MATSNKGQTRNKEIVKEIQKKFGNVIDIGKNPLVLVEIIRAFGHRFDAQGGGGTGGVDPGVSTVAVGITPPQPAERGAENPNIIRAILAMHRDVKALHKKVDRMAPSASAKRKR